MIGPPGPAYGDTISGTNLAGGIAAALLKRERTGEPSVVDVSLLGSGLWSMGQGLLGCPDRTSALATAGAALLVIYGENDDAWEPSVQDEMAHRLGAERVCVPGAAHSPAVEAPETVGRALTTFWNSVEATR